jgi:hypothetical protein
MDLHELAAALKPAGWRESLGPGDGLAGLWRPREGGRAEFIRLSGTRRVVVYGNGLEYDGPIGEVVGYLASKEKTK